MRREALVTLICDGVTVGDLAEAAGTIGREVLTSLGRATTGSRLALLAWAGSTPISAAYSTARDGYLKVDR
jgi:hypothetical protein